VKRNALPNNLRLLIQKSNAYDIFAFIEQQQENPDNELIESYTVVMDEIDRKLSKWTINK
jgi:succinate dehydrogenase flavin-adding protein (antitoxin of CptAB toxin-antitoxin module)